MKLTPAQIEIMTHALGIDKKGRVSDGYRNHYCAGGDDETTCRELVAAGYMATFTRSYLPYYNCIVTTEGKAALQEELGTANAKPKAQKRPAGGTK